MSKFWDGDFDWTDAVLLLIVAILIGTIGVLGYHFLNKEPTIVYVTNTEYVNVTIPVPIRIIEYEIIEVPSIITETNIIEIPVPMTLRDFSSEEMLMAWIENDDTDEIEYTGRWTCMDFTLRTIENAREDGYMILFVYWQNYNDSGGNHAICMAYCIDEAKYVTWEPQSDKILWEWVSSKGG